MSRPIVLNKCTQIKLFTSVFGVPLWQQPFGKNESNPFIKYFFDAIKVSEASGFMTVR